MSLFDVADVRGRVKQFVPHWLLRRRREWLASRAFRREFRLHVGDPPEGLAITLHGDCGADAAARILFDALVRTLRPGTKDLGGVLDIEGMSGLRYRRLVNEIVASLPHPSYLEIGSWVGSTACAAMYGNRAEVTCIDDWSEFGGRGEFLRNIDSAKNPNISFQHIEADFRQVDYGRLGSFNIYFYDGPHAEADQYDAVRLTQAALAATHILIVDDWNWLDVRVGTLRGLADERLQVPFSIEIRTTQDNSHPVRDDSRSDWHNGYLLCVCRKRGAVEAEPAPPP
jgi:hypothetical protein